MKTTDRQSKTKERLVRRVKSTLLNREIEIDFTNVDHVVGTRDAVTPWSTERRCALCHHPVYTSLVYPEEVRILCEQCAVTLPENDS